MRVWKYFGLVFFKQENVDSLEITIFVRNISAHFDLGRISHQNIAEVCIHLIITSSLGTHAEQGTPMAPQLPSHQLDLPPLGDLGSSEGPRLAPSQSHSQPKSFTSKDFS